MAHITLNNDSPGIRGLVLNRPDTGKLLYQLVQLLLRGPSSLSPAERELIAAHVSAGNKCRFCTASHAAAASVLYENEQWVEDILAGNVEKANPGPKVIALLQLAGLVQQSGKMVTTAVVEEARNQGATDQEIHDTVLIAATFSLFNRYVDGLAAFTPVDKEIYREMGLRMVQNGYIYPETKH